jgi:hypothetical protein
VLADLAGTTSLSGLVAIAISGRRLGADEERMLDDLAVCLAVAEPRIWPLKLTRLVASYGGAMAGFCAGHAMIEGSIVGGWASVAAGELLEELSGDVADGLDDDARVDACCEALVGRTRRISGFGVPFRPRDERVIALGKCVEQRGRARGRYWRLMSALTATTRRVRGLEVNMGSATAAVLLDLGFKTTAIGPITVMLMANFFLSNAIEGAEQREPVLRELPAALVRYVGTPPRSVVR